MQPLTLYLGTKWISSWSLRPYLALAHAGATFDEQIIELDRPDTRAAIRAVIPSGRVPALRHGDLLIWDSLAICEYVAELFPDARLWPLDRAARARARAVSAEMHSGFAALRQHMPFDLRHDRSGEGHVPEALADAARVMEIWRDCLAASGGPFLFGDFTIADAMFAPVTTRFLTYGVALDDVSTQYVATVTAFGPMTRWRAEARG